MILAITIIFLGFVCLVIVAIKYDQIVPPIHNFIVSILPLESFKKASNQAKTFVLLFFLSPFFMLFHFSQFNKLPEFEDLLKIDAEKIEHYRENSYGKYGSLKEINFKVNGQYYLKSCSDDSGYNLLKNAIKTGEKLIFWISPDDYSGKIFQFSINGKIISSYKQTLRLEKKSLHFTIIFTILVMIVGGRKLFILLHEEKLRLQNKANSAEL